jgi:hypothetical protein
METTLSGNRYNGIYIQGNILMEQRLRQFYRVGFNWNNRIAKYSRWGLYNWVAIYKIGDINLGNVISG